MRVRRSGMSRSAAYAPVVLMVAAAGQDAMAATADSREFSSPGSSTSSITFNVVSEGLVSGASRPLQLVTASTPDGLSVSTRLNCITVTGFMESDFQISYTVTEGLDTPGNQASGVLDFVAGSNNPGVAEVAPVDESCLDPQHIQASPVADSVTVNSGETTPIAVLANDSNVTPQVSRIVIESQPDGGTLSVQGDQVLFTPNPEFLGTVQFSYAIADYSLYSDVRSQSADVTVEVVMAAPNLAPVANAGADQTLEDSDREPGEDVVLDGSESSDSDGTIVSYVWTDAEGVEIATGANPTVRLPDGTNVITLTVRDDLGLVASDTVTINVAVASQPETLESLANLTPNQRAIARALDDVCDRLGQASSNEQSLTEDQLALLDRCNSLLFDNDENNQRQALDELNGEELTAARTQTLLFANFQYAGVMDRLIALRGGASGLSLAGLNLMLDGQQVPLSELQRVAKLFLGGGASADEPGGLLSDKWGIWARGNYSFGEKALTANAPGFDADQWTLMAGVDYRLSAKSVVGVALAYGDSEVKFTPSGEGGLDTTSWAGSVYGSLYAARNFYFDAVLNVADSNYDARRSINYVDASGEVSAQARGETGGLTLSGGASLGYDFLIGGLTLSPTAGVFYVDSYIDGFVENGAAGLNLAYEQQDFTSLTTTLGMRATFAWNLSWGVLLPHLRADFVREYEDDIEVFGARFAADPFSDSASNPTTPILVQSDNPDRSYWRLAAGFSAQLPHGISGYVEYQRLESFQFIDFQDISIGLRFQRSF